MDELPIEISCPSVKALRDRGEPFLLVDCRTPGEWEITRIADSKLLPMSEIVERISELEPHRDQRIVVHCHHGGRSQRVVLWLRQQGFAQAQNMTGGIDAWAVDVDPTLPRY